MVRNCGHFLACLIRSSLIRLLKTNRAFDVEKVMSGMYDEFIVRRDCKLTLLIISTQPSVETLCVNDTACQNTTFESIHAK